MLFRHFELFTSLYQSDSSNPLKGATFCPHMRRLDEGLPQTLFRVQQRNGERAFKQPSSWMAYTPEIYEVLSLTQLEKNVAIAHPL